MRLDMHIHSRYSEDSRMEVREIIRTAHRRGIAWIAITDHNSILGALRALRENMRDVHILPGVEVSTSKGHILAYGVREGIERGLSPEDTVECIRALGGLASIAHPRRFWSGVGEKVSLGLDTDLIEVHNARTSAQGNAAASGIAERRGLPGSAGSDAHEYVSVGRGVLVLEGEVETEDDLIARLRKGEGRPAGESRTLIRSVQYASKCVSGWALRGFRRI